MYVVAMTRKGLTNFAPAIFVKRSCSGECQNVNMKKLNENRENHLSIFKGFKLAFQDNRW